MTEHFKSKLDKEMINQITYETFDEFLSLDNEVVNLLSDIISKVVFDETNEDLLYNIVSVHDRVLDRIGAFDRGFYYEDRNY